MGNCCFKEKEVDNRVDKEEDNLPQTAQFSGPANSCSRDADSSGPFMQTSGRDSIGSKDTSYGSMIKSEKLRVFTYDELRIATRNFRPDSLIGEGGFGCVFKGILEEHGLLGPKSRSAQVIAVKKMSSAGFQGHKEWLAEVNYLGQLHHPNLVKLIGYCLEDDNYLLVYDYMAKGSLDNHLFRRISNFQPIPWETRVKILLGAAKGLAFLHGAEPQVIYRDLKTSNILLDSDYNAKLSDFGLAKHGPSGDNTHVSTRVVGTYGYAAPEYVATGHLTAKNDVYSFGVLMLELLTGRRALDKNRSPGEQNLVEWAKRYLGDNKHKALSIIDYRMQMQYPPKAAYTATTVARHCLTSDPKHRPSMRTVVETLEEIHNMDEPYAAHLLLVKDTSSSGNRSGSFQRL